MRWSTKVRAVELMRGSFWVFAVPGMALGILAGYFLIRLDHRYEWSLLALTAGGAQAFLGSSVATLISLLGIAFSVVVLIVQLAAGQLSPRVVKPALGGRYAKVVLTVAVFSLGYVLSVLLRSGKENVPQLSVLVSVPLVVGSIIGFVGFLDRVGRGTRHSHIIQNIALMTKNSIERVYPVPYGVNGRERAADPAASAEPPRTIRYRGRAGMVQAYHLKGLASLAARLDAYIRIVCEVGEYVYPGAELFRVRSAAAHLPEPELLDSVAVGTERSLARDPPYGFRLLVDVAIKALSPAINDPTTAVAVLDAEEHLLMLLAGRDLESPVNTSPRIALPLPTWESYTELACTEIRIFAATSISVLRRMRALLEHLREQVPPERQAVLTRQLALLARATEAALSTPEERAMGGVADPKGLG